VPAIKALGDPITVTTSDATVTDVTIEGTKELTIDKKTLKIIFR
jgi:hypothetical protein